MYLAGRFDRDPKRAPAPAQGSGPGWAPGMLVSWLGTQPQGPRYLHLESGKPTASPALPGRDHHDDGQQGDRRQRDHQRDQDVGGWPEVAMPVLSITSSGWSLSWPRGQVGLVTGRAEDVVGVGIPEVRHGPTPLPSEVRKVARPARTLRSEPAGGDHDGSTGITPTGRGRRGSGAETPRRPQREEALLPEGWRPAPAVAGIPRWRDFADAFVADLADLTSPKPRGRGRWRHGELVSDWPRSSCRRWARGASATLSGGYDLRPRGPTSPARPAPGGRGRTLRLIGPLWPDRGGRPDQHDGCGAGAGTWSGAGREPAQ
jgi:hypothetical protein